MVDDRLGFKNPSVADLKKVSNIGTLDISRKIGDIKNYDRGREFLEKITEATHRAQNPALYKRLEEIEKNIADNEKLRTENAAQKTQLARMSMQYNDVCVNSDISEKNNAKLINNLREQLNDKDREIAVLKQDKFYTTESLVQLNEDFTMIKKELNQKIINLEEACQQIVLINEELKSNIEAEGYEVLDDGSIEEQSRGDCLER